MLRRFFDFWLPYRTNREDVDFPQGQAYCEEAIVYARTSGDRYFLPNVMASIRLKICQGVEWGALEWGFFDRAASRATYGVTPPPLSDMDIEIWTASGGHKKDDLRQGEADAAETLKTARLNNCPDAIFNYLIEIHSGGHPVGVEAQIYVIAGAALAGSAN